MEQNKPKMLKNEKSRRIICTPGPAARNTFFYVQEAGFYKSDDPAAARHRDLDSFLMAAVISGRGELTVDGDTAQLVKGDCFFIDCRQPYFYKSSDTEPWELLWVYFNGSTSRQYYEYFISHSGNTFRPPFFDKVVSAVTELISINEQKDPNAEILSSKLIVDLLTIALTVSTGEYQYDSSLKQKLAAVHSYIDDHFAEDISLEKLSSEFYISKFYLTREYKKIYGMTIFQHIITARINYGKKLLRFSDKSVEEIAHLCGFNDQSYFARQFKKSENLTCHSYRKMWRE